MTYEEAIKAGAKPVEDSADHEPSLMHQVGEHVKAAGHGFLQGALSDFGDEAVAGMTAGGEPGTLRDTAQAYHEELPAIRAEFKASEHEHPVANTIGRVAGSIASPLNKLTGGGSMLKLAASGALTGGLSAAGHSEASNVQDLAADTGIGAGIGSVAAPIIGAGINKLAPGAQAMLERMAGKMGLWSAGALGSDFARIAKEAGHDIERPADAGLELLKRKLIGRLGQPADVLRNVKTALKGLETQQGTAIDAMNTAGNTVDMHEITERLLKELVPAEHTPLGAVQDARRAVATILKQAGAEGIRGPEAEGTVGGLFGAPKFFMQRPVPFSRADELKSEIQKRAYTDGNEAYKDVAPAMRREIRNAADAIGGPAAASYKEANDAMTKLLAVKDVAAHRAASKAGNSPLGLLAALGSGTGATIGVASHSPSIGALAGLGMAGATKLAQTYGSPIGANVTFKLAQALRTAPERFGKYAPTLLRAMQEGPRALYLAYRHFKDNNVDMSGDASGGTPGMGQ